MKSVAWMRYGRRCMRALVWNLDTLYVGSTNGSVLELVRPALGQAAAASAAGSSVVHYPGPLGRSAEAVPGLLDYLNLRPEPSALDMYLSQLLRKLDPRSSLFLLATPEMNVNTSVNPAARLLVLLCQKDLLGAVNLAKEHTQLWALVLAFIAAVKAEPRITEYAISAFAQTAHGHPHSCAETVDSTERDGRIFLDCILHFIRVSTAEDLDQVWSVAEPGILGVWRIYASLFGSYATRKFAYRFLANLGRSLVQLGKQVEAGHVCLLLAGEVPGAVDDPRSLFAILGADHHDSEKLGSLVDPHRVARTEILEFALRLNDPEFDCLPGLQPFKLVLAKKFAEAGDEARAQKYVTFINAFVRALPANKFSTEFKTHLREFEKFLLVRNNAGGIPVPVSEPQAAHKPKSWF